MSENNFQKILDRLKRLSERGPIAAKSTGSNAIGKTLQDALGIQHTVTTKNSLLGFVVTGTNIHGNTRTNLFARVPDWTLSDVKSSTEIVNRYGKEDPNGKYARSLFCTVDTSSPNSFGLQLFCDRGHMSLSEAYVDGDKIDKFAEWRTSHLKQKLDGLDNTVIVSALRTIQNGQPHFHFVRAEFLLSPSIDVFFHLIDIGAISLDHLISLPFDKAVGREQGPLFKMRPQARESLFQSYSRIDLLA